MRLMLTLLLLTVTTLGFAQVREVELQYLCDEVDTSRCTRLAWQVEAPGYASCYAQQGTDGRRWLCVATGATSERIALTDLGGTLGLRFDAGATTTAVTVRWNGATVATYSVPGAGPGHVWFTIPETRWPYAALTRLTRVTFRTDETGERTLTFDAPTDLRLQYADSMGRMRELLQWPGGVPVLGSDGRDAWAQHDPTKPYLARGALYAP